MSQSPNPLLLPVERGTSQTTEAVVGRTSSVAAPNPYASAVIPMALVNGVVATIGVCVPALRAQFLTEDGFLESLTALAFAAAAVVGSVAYARGNRRCRWYLLVPVCAAIGFLEETSYGERWFGWPMPTLGGIKFDALHDVIELGYASLKRGGVDQWQMGAVMLIGGLVALLSMPRDNSRIRRALVRLVQHSPLAMLAGAVLLCLAAAVLDLKVGSQLLRTFEEFAEFNAALLLICAACHAGRPSPEAAA